MMYYYKCRYITVLVSALVLCLVFTFNVKTAQADTKASLQFSISGDSGMTATVRNISDGEVSADNTITWSSISAGEGWKIADQHIELTYDSSIPELWGLQIYTDNKSSTADPRYMGTGNPAGLIKVMEDSIFSLPMIWLIKDERITPEQPIERSDRGGFTTWDWHYFKDKSGVDMPFTPIDESFTDAEDYVVLWNQSGIGWNEGGRSGKPATAYVYLAANFIMASVNSQYATNTLSIETYHGISPFPLYIYKDSPKIGYKVEHTGTSTRTDYKADIEIPDYDSSINLGESINISAEITNSGTITWTTGSFRFRAHGYLPNGTYVNDLAGNGYYLPRDVLPGRTVIMNLEIPTGTSAQVNHTGNSRIGVDMVHEGVTWFDNEVRVAVEIIPQDQTSQTTLENHYAPGFMNYNENIRNPNITVYDAYPNNPHTGNHCLKIHWDGSAGADHWNWAGIMWLEPEQEWNGGTDIGYDLRGATYLSFWARVDAIDEGSQVKSYFGLIPGDSHYSPRIWRSPALTTEWREYRIPIFDGDMSHIAGGFGIVFNDEHDGNIETPGYTVYLDDIEFLGPD